MKVYCVFEGEYSDRRLNGVFSTKSLAEEYIRRQKMLGEYWGGVDDEPIEYELDEELSSEYAVFWCSETGCNIHTFGQQDGPPEDRKNFTVISVRYNPDFDVMLKSAQDRYAEHKAQQAGI